MPPRTIDDATARHLEEIAVDITGLLGPGIELVELVREAEGAAVVILRARYRLADEAVESIGRGSSVIEAHTRLRDAIVSDRVGLGLRVLSSSRPRRAPSRAGRRPPG
jgi:hypothetical protein